VGSYADIRVADSVVLRANELQEQKIPPEDIKATIKDEFRKETKSNTYGQYPYRRLFVKARNQHTVLSHFSRQGYKMGTYSYLGDYADIHVAESVVLRANELREAQIPPEEIKATITDEFKKKRFQNNADINTYGLHSFASIYDRKKGTHAVSACFANTLSRVYLGAYADIHVAESVVLRANELRDAQTPPEDIKVEVQDKFNKTTDNTNTHGLHPFSSSYDRKKDTHAVSACLEYLPSRFCLCVCPASVSQMQLFFAPMSCETHKFRRTKSQRRLKMSSTHAFSRVFKREKKIPHASTKCSHNRFI
jgi:hypothetical protein